MLGHILASWALHFAHIAGVLCDELVVYGRRPPKTLCAIVAIFDLGIAN
jgi:hypothetical protein